MKKGLVIGKFMPIHKGHMKLIEFALNNCDNLTILLYSKKSDPIDGKLRYEWVKYLYKNYDNVNVAYMDNELPNDKKFKDEDILKWCDYIKSRFPNIDVFFSSEKYGDYLAKYMNIDHIVYDLNRNSLNISGTNIRDNPLKYIDYLPDIVKSYFLKENNV